MAIPFEREKEKERIKVERGKENVKKEDKGGAREGDDKERRGRQNKHSDDLHTQVNRNRDIEISIKSIDE